MAINSISVVTTYEIDKEQLKEILRNQLDPIPSKDKVRLEFVTGYAGDDRYGSFSSVVTGVKVIVNN